ncbi:MAG: hypothetical protein GYA24_12735 [Candidatus Lokiarchaeota archaeon]|nr:hypothetical protein [Candidatus Lokiarchaeota archaeon]
MATISIAVPPAGVYAYSTTTLFASAGSVDTSGVADTNVYMPGWCWFNRASSTWKYVTAGAPAPVPVPLPRFSLCFFTLLQNGDDPPTMSDFIFLCEKVPCKPGLCRHFARCNSETRALRRVHDAAMNDLAKHPVKGYMCDACRKVPVGAFPGFLCPACQRAFDTHADLF